jgi:tRNA (cytidine/uridine-2'-O-)-methyltransferase
MGGGEDPGAVGSPGVIDVVLYQPEIPPNTGNVIRLCANTGARLHLVEPLGYSLDDKQLKRAGLDYHELACMTVHPDWPAVRAALAGRRWFALSTKATRGFHAVQFEAGDVVVFGPETRGLPETVLAEFPAETRLRIPMLPGNRSVNLSNAVAVVVFEALRQHRFPGCK